MKNFYRSALYVPADHDRAMAKATSRGADILIFDLEDGVAPEKKVLARDAIVSLLSSPVVPANDDTPISPDPGMTSTKIVRINHRDTPYYIEDLTALAHTNFDGVMLSKVAGPEDIEDACMHLATHHRADLPIWCNVETPRGIVHAREIAACPGVRGLVAGTNDLANDLRIRRTSCRAGLISSLQELVLAGRAYGCIILDGTFIDLNDEGGLRAESEQGRMLGFDGKTLIHPKQIAIANEVYGPDNAEINEAYAIIDAYQSAMAAQKAVTVLNGRMIEKLHYERAKALVGMFSE